MSSKDLMVGYDVTVRGQYYSASGKDRILKVFGPVTFFLPEYVEIPNGKKKIEKKNPDGRKVVTFEPQTAKRAVTVENVALYIVQRRILPTWLVEHHPDAVGFRTCSIIPGGMRRVQRPKSEAIILDKPVDDMSLQELAAFCKLKQLNTPIAAFTDVLDAREAVKYDLALLTNPKAAAPFTQPVRTAQEMDAPLGVETRSGVVSSEDGVPTDEEDPAAELLR